MSDAYWERIKAVFEAALAAPMQDRSAILDRECGSDVNLRSEVESLLNARTQAYIRTAGAAHAMADTTATSAPGEQAGAQIGRYKLLQLIGEGGFGSVWMAEQKEPVKRRVAIKIIKFGMETQQVIARFEAERQALAMMDHPNIAKVLDAGATETGRPYFVMEYIKGVAILEYCDKTILDTRARLELFGQVCNAIQHAHQKGIIHRDIKPSNVLVTMHDGIPVPKVIDFGIAKATNSELTSKTLFTEHRRMVGTPAYMSPEQAEMSGLDIDTRSDIYSLGVLLYELLTGTTPFDTKSLMEAGFAEMVRIIREVEPPKPSTRMSSLGETGTHVAQRRHAGDTRQLGSILRGDLDWIVMKCLEKDRTRRYETAFGLAADIKRYLSDEPVMAGAPGAGYRLRKFVKRYRVQVIAGGIVTGALLLGVIGTSSGLVWAIKEKTRATLAAQAAEASKEEEAKARKRAETISTFVTTALKASDAQNFGGAQVEANAAYDMTILAAMDNAIKDIDSGRFKDDPETEAGLRNTIGVILRNNGKYDKARPLLEQALLMRERLFTDDNPLVAESLNNLAELHYQQDRYDEAEPLFARALAILEHVRGPNHVDVAASLNNLATLYGAKGQYSQAELLFTRALKIRESALGSDDPDVANSLSNLAVVYGVQGQNARAEPLHKRALEIREKTLGAEHPDVANTLYNLASLYGEQGQYSEAEPLFERALAIYQKSLGPDHPLVATMLSHLAGLYQSQGQYARAEPLFQKALEINETAYGPNHTNVAFSLNNLAALFQVQGKIAQVESLAARALAIRESALGSEHPDVATDLNSLAELYLAMGQYDKAEPYFRRALSIREKVFSEEHIDVAQSVNNLAALYYSQGQYTKAEPLFQRALAIREKVLGPDHSTVAASLNNLAMLYFNLAEYDRAEPLYTRALAINEKALGPAHPSVATSLHNLATLYYSTGQFTQSESLFARALAIWVDSLGPNHPNVAQCMSGLARTRFALGKTVEARKGFDDALAMLRTFSPDGSPLLARVLWQSASTRLDDKGGGNAVNALPELEEAIAIAERFLPPNHPHLKEYREALANCREAVNK